MSEAPPEQPSPVPAAAPVPPPLPRASRLLPVTLVLAILAGLAGGALGGSIYPVVKPGTHTVQQMGGPVDLPNKEDLDLAESRNSAIQYGILGGIVGLALGVAGLVGGAASTSRLRPLGPVLGGLNGALIVGAFGLVAMPLVLAKIHPSNEDMLPAMGVHAILLGLIGLAAGIGFAVALGGGRALSIRALLGALIGALVGSVVFDLLGGIVFPVDGTTDPIPKSFPSQLLISVVGATAIGLGIALAILDAGRGRKTPGAPAA